MTGKLGQWTSPQEAISEIYDFFGAGVAAADSIPAAIGAFVVAKGDPRDTILYAANMGGDCDTVASMAGAIAGAFAGTLAIPGDWASDIQRINDLHLEDTAQALLNLAGEWNSQE